MHTEVLTEEQRALLALIQAFSDDYCLVGGTAIALYIAHRRSIDFDLFTVKEIRRKRIRNVIEKGGWPVDRLLYEASDQVHLVVNSVKLTFFSFPHDIAHPIDFNGIISMPTLLDLASMKTYALGGRAKWKDYVDLYFILKDHHGLNAISTRAADIFGSYFNEKLLREQLCFFEDVDFSEQIDYLDDDIEEEEIKTFLVNVATTEFV